MTVIFAYTRAQAIQDGMLVDVSEAAKKAGFVVNTVITSPLHHTLQDFPEGSLQRYETRLNDVLEMAYVSASVTNPMADRVLFPVRLMGRDYNRQRVELLAMVGPDDAGRSCLTIGYPGDF